MEVRADKDYHLVVAFEEPELYQHPPQARLLNEYLMDIAKSGQVLITTHSSIFVDEDIFGKFHVVRNVDGKTAIHSLSLEKFTEQIAGVFGIDSHVESTVASLSTSLSLKVKEIFFSKFVIIIEGQEDYGYLQTAINLYGNKKRFLEGGYNIVPALGKNDISPVIELCKAFHIPFFVVFDSDSNTAKKENGIKKTNIRLRKQLGSPDSEPLHEQIDSNELFWAWPLDIKDSLVNEHPEFLDYLYKAKTLCGCKNFKNAKLTSIAVQEYFNAKGKLLPLEQLLDHISNNFV